MKMKIRIAFSIILISIVFPAFVIGQGSVDLPKPGLTPDSPFYFFDTAFEKVNLFFTFNPERKAQKALSYANERLAEVEVVANKSKSKAVAIAMANYQEKVSLAKTESKKIKDKEKIEDLLSTIVDNTSKHQEILAELYNKVPEEAKEAIEKAIEISIKSQEEALKEIQALKKTVEELQKDIELLKQQGQSDQSKEIEILRKEIEALKSQQSSPSAKPQVIEKVVEKIVEVPPPTLQKSTSRLSNTEIIEKVKPAVVYIQTSDGSGSGMIIESDGYVLTNAHVVSGVNTAKIKLSDGRLFIGSIIGRDENIDLALLKIKSNNLPTVVLGDSSENALKQGDEVFAFGYPFGLEGDVSFKEGTISRRQTYEGIIYLETSAQVHPGNSGGPLVDKSAQVIGINTQAVGMGVSGVLVGESIKFALPINLVRGFIPELKSGRNVVLPKTTLPALPSLPTLPPSPQPTPQPSPMPEPKAEPKPEPVKTTIFNIKAEKMPYSLLISWDSNKSPLSSKHRVLVGKKSDLSDAVELKVIYKSAYYGDIGDNKDNILQPDTTYYYQIFVKDGCTTCKSYDPVEAKTEIFSITTSFFEPFETLLSPVISNIKSSNITKDSVVISWNTDIGTGSKLEYKEETSGQFILFCPGPSMYCSSYTEILSKTVHQYTITGLKNDTSYVYRITALDTIKERRPKSISDTITFKTLAGDTTPTTTTTTEPSTTTTTEPQ